jgi:uncharacterized protein (TIGR02266 family)
VSFDDPQNGDPAGRDPFGEPPGTAEPGDPSSQRYPRAELRRKVSLKFKEFQGFVNEYSENVSAGGMFIRTSSPQPVGTVFDFELTLGDDYTLIHGLGEVVWVRERDEGFDRPPGMGVRFLSLDPGSRRLIDRMVAERLARGGGSGPARDPHLAPVATDAQMGSLDDAAWWDDEEAAPARTVRVGSGQLSSISDADGPRGGTEREPDRGYEPGAYAGAEEPARPSIFDEPPRPRSSGPSPYIYSRSYQGSSYSNGGGDKSRKVLVVLLVLVAVVAAVAAFVLLAPETARSWLPFGEPEDGTLVARESGDDAGDDADTPSEPVEPVAPEDARPLPRPDRPELDPDADGVEEGAGDEAAGEEDAGAEERGFFQSERPAEPEPVPPPEPATGGAATRVLNVTWEERDGATLVTVHLDAGLEEWSYSSTRLASPPRELVRIDGIRNPFPRPTIPVGTPRVERVRLGFHPEGRTSQMHVVIDLADPGARLDRSETVGNELRLWITPGNG